jgi:CelD/BcsL family acetyltransferase involved in cellulose biosynthesis
MWERQQARPGRRPAVIVGRVDGRIRLVWPLVAFRSRLWRVVRGLSEDMADYDDILVADAPEADRWRRAAWDFALATLRPDMMLFRRIPDGSGLDRLIGPAMPISQRRSLSLCVEFHAGWDGYWQQVDKDLRQRLRRGKRWLQQFGEVRFAAVADPDAGATLIDWAFARKHERLGAHAFNRREKTEHASFGRDLPFLTDVARHAFHAGRLQVQRLSAGDRTVAVSLTLIDGRRMVGWLYAYDEQFAKAAPGHLVCMECLALAHAEGFGVVDLMPEPDPYKRKWAEQGYAVRDVRVAATGWGRLLVLWHRSSLRGLALALYMRAPRPVQLAIRRLFR